MAELAYLLVAKRANSPSGTTSNLWTCPSEPVSASSKTGSRRSGRTLSTTSMPGSSRYGMRTYLKIYPLSSWRRWSGVSNSPTRAQLLGALSQGSRWQTPHCTAYCLYECHRKRLVSHALLLLYRDILDYAFLKDVDVDARGASGPEGQQFCLSCIAWLLTSTHNSE